MPLFLYFSFSTHKQCVLGQFYTTTLQWLPNKPAGFEPRSSIPQTYALSTAPLPHATARVFGALSWIVQDYVCVCSKHVLMK
jgi:hypothetical protein